jgi:hypothetical protein
LFLALGSFFAHIGQGCAIVIAAINTGTSWLYAVSGMELRHSSKAVITAAIYEKSSQFGAGVE